MILVWRLRLVKMMKKYELNSDSGFDSWKLHFPSFFCWLAMKTRTKVSNLIKHDLRLISSDLYIKLFNIDLQMGKHIVR